MEAILQSRVSALIAIILISAVVALGQSAETGNPFNKYMSPEGGVNPMSGTVALSKSLASISSGDAQALFTMNYSGNVTQPVNNRNDIAPTGWLGLGWSMGFAKIVSDHNGSMALDDDTYYLQTAEGTQHKLIKDNSGKWWITGLPYWKIEPSILENVQFGNNSYKIIVGWTLIDDSGKKYFYGDFASSSELTSGNVKGNATQYVLCWPKTKGFVGLSTGGEDFLFPNAWNLLKIEDLKGNSLSYEYYSMKEKLLINGWTSRFGYTKENYLKKVMASNGGYVEFEIKSKGIGDFKDEFLDLNGDAELTEDDADAFVDPIERHYLASVKMYGKDGSLISNVEFCYGSLFLAPDGKKDSRYVKRILKSVVFKDISSNIVDQEKYEYNINSIGAAVDKSIPLGMMTAVQGNNCGRVEFEYTYMTSSNENALGLHSDVVPMTKVSSIGYLENGTPYIAGFKDGYVAIYLRVFGKWVLAKQFLNDEDLKEYEDEDNKGSFSIGDKGWFIYTKPDEESAKYSVIVWDGLNFIKEKTVSDNGKRDNVVIGVGYILKIRIYDDGASYSHISLSIPWAKWKKDGYEKNVFYNIEGNVDNDFRAEDGSNDRKYIYGFASANHVGVFYLDTDGGNNGRVRVYSFNHDKTRLIKTFEKHDLDDDNRYSLNGDFLYGATEDKGIYGHNAEVYQWKEGGDKGAAWYKSDSWNLHGVRLEPSIQAMGSNYFAVMHNDNDDMSLFYYDGERWSTPYKNKNMVSGDNFDFFYEAEWKGYSGNNFFIAREPLVEPKTITIHYWVPRRWSLKHKKKEIEVWSSTYRGALLDRYDLRDGIWSNTGAENLHNSTHKTHLMVGTDWYVEKTSDKAFVWNGYEWNWKKLGVPDYGSEGDYKSLGANSFAIEKDKQTTIYYKKSDSFNEIYGVYLVTSKKVLDPVTDKIVTYQYNYNWSDSDISFDILNNTPLVSEYTVTLPNYVGSITKTLCNYEPVIKPNGIGKTLGLGVGKICNEVTKNNTDLVTTTTKTNYDRFAQYNWPNEIYQDRVTSVVTTTNKHQSEVKYEYSFINGQPSSVTTYLDGKSTASKQRRVSYAAEIFPNMKEANRLTEEAGVYEFVDVSEIGVGKVISVSASNYMTIDNGYEVVSDVWSCKEIGSINCNFMYNLPTSNKTNNELVNSNYWVKNIEYSKYRFKRAVETIDRLGIKSSAIYENKIDGLLLGNVINAGFDEVLLLPGESESIENWSPYNVISLECGNAVDYYNRENNEKCQDKDNPINYGHYAKSAVLVNSSNKLEGTLTPSKTKSYIISARVQGVDAANGTVDVLVDGVSVHSKNLTGSGIWQYIECEVSLSGTTHTIEFRTNFGNNMRVQNAVVIPSNAQATVTYWDEQWNKPTVTVNDRGVGSYSVLDNSGRVIQTYTEDVLGNLVKLSEREYFVSDCRESPSGKNTLSSLRINGQKVTGLALGKTLTYVVPNSTDEIDIQWETSQKGDDVRYQFIKQGESTNTWQDACCSSLDGITKSLEGAENWVLGVDVSAYKNEANDHYKINIIKSTSGWIDYGAPLAVGHSPVFASSSNPSNLYYLAKNALIPENYNGNTWSNKNPKNPEADVLQGKFDYLQAFSNGNKSFVLTLPYVNIEGNDVNTTAKVYQGLSALSSYGNVGLAGEMSGFYRITVDKNGIPYVLYEKSTNSVTSTISNLVVKKYDNGEWQYIGNSVSIDENNEKPVLIPNIVSDYGVKDADITIGPDGNVYVAYIGQISQIKTTINDSYTDENGEVQNGQNTISPRFVVVKRLYNNKEVDETIDEKVWAGPSKIQDGSASSFMLPDFGGDIIEVLNQNLEGNEEVMPITTATRVKFASDSKNLYLAIVYQLYSKTNENKVNFSKKRYALSIFKATQKNETVVDEDGVLLNKQSFTFEPLLDQSVKAPLFGSIVNVEKRIVAYLDENDPFDFVVHNAVPYVMFANESNDHKLTVIQYNGTRWLSVGKPAFVDVQETANSADLAVNSSGSPYVVVKESNRSNNRNRQNKIVPLKYSSTGDKDLTIKSLGDVAGTSISSEFRQYILNYSAEVLENVSTITIAPTLKTIADVCAVVLENNEELVSSWKTSSSCDWNSILPGVVPTFTQSTTPNMDIPLAPGMNYLTITVYGVNGDRITYNTSIVRPMTPKADVSVLGDGNELRLMDSTIVFVVDEELNIRTDTLKYISYGSTPIRRICIQFNAFWKMIFKEKIYYASSCIDYDFSEPDDEYGYEKELVVFVNENNSNKVIIKFIDGSHDRNKEDAFFESSSSNGGSESSSSSSSNGGSESSSSSSSSETIGIPQEYVPLLNYKMYAQGNLIISDRVKLASGSYSCSYVNVGANASVLGTLYSNGNVDLRSHSYVESLYYSGSLNVQDGAHFGNGVQASIDLPQLPLMNVAAGTSDITVANGQNLTLVPGKYKKLQIYSNATVSFEPGEYFFESVVIEPDASIYFLNRDFPIRLWIQGNLSIGDRVKPFTNGLSEDLFIYTNTNNLYLGVTSMMRAILVAPNASINMASRSQWGGQIWAKEITIQPDVIVE